MLATCTFLYFGSNFIDLLCHYQHLHVENQSVLYLGSSFVFWGLSTIWCCVFNLLKSFLVMLMVVYSGGT